MRGLRLRVSGRVQGVFFRNWAIDEARATGIRGWVRNRTDGSVEILAFGEGAALDGFVARCHQGPRAAEVEQVEVADAGGEPPQAFTRERTV